MDKDQWGDVVDTIDSYWPQARFGVKSAEKWFGRLSQYDHLKVAEVIDRLGETHDRLPPLATVKTMITAGVSGGVKCDCTGECGLDHRDCSAEAEGYAHWCPESDCPLRAHLRHVCNRCYFAQGGVQGKTGSAAVAIAKGRGWL